jgi:hypothetical protein
MTVNKKQICNVAFIVVVSKVIGEVFISNGVVSVYLKLLNSKLECLNCMPECLTCKLELRV